MPKIKTNPPNLAEDNPISERQKLLMSQNKLVLCVYIYITQPSSLNLIKNILKHGI